MCVCFKVKAKRRVFVPLWGPLGLHQAGFCAEFAGELGACVRAGPLAYIQASDCIVTSNAALELECYRFKTLADATGEQLTPKGRGREDEDSGDSPEKPTGLAACAGLLFMGQTCWIGQGSDSEAACRCVGGVWGECRVVSGA